MASDNRYSRQDKIEHFLRMSQGMTPEQAAADLAAEYEMTPHEAEAARDFLAGQTLPQYKALKGIINMAIDHPRQEVAMAVIMKAWGITDEQMYYGFIRQLTNAVSADGKADISELNAAIAMVAGIQPRDHLEAMLAVQMATVHFAALRHQRLMVTSDTIERLDIHERTVNKLMRTFTSQMEALRKHRNGGNQKVVVEHVHVHEGGQAIVGNVTHGGEGRKRTGAQFHEQGNLSISTGAAVLGHIEADQMPMQGAGGAREEGLPVSRGKSRSAKG